MKLGTEETATTALNSLSTSSPLFTQEEKYPPTKIAQSSGYPAKNGAKFTAARKLQALRQHVLEDPEISAELAYYVPPNGQPSALSTQSDPLQPWIEKEFLHSEARVLLLKGPGGAGKSTFNRHLLCQLWQDPAWAEWKPGEVPSAAAVPVFIPLGSSQVNPKRLLAFLSHLPEPLESFTDEEINVLKEDYQMLLIADGYDEIPGGGKLNLYDANSLGKYQGRVKLLVSSRDFIGREPVESAQLVPHALETGRAEYRYYRERWVSAFSESQVADYLERYLAKNKDRTDIILWPDVATYQEHFKAFAELKPLISAPFLLWIAAEALPSIVQGVELELKETQEKESKHEEKSREKEPEMETKNSTSPDRERKIEIKDELKETKGSPVSLPKSRKEMTRLRLYAQFMEQWFYRQAEKAASSKDWLEDPEALLGEEGMVAVQTATGVSGDLLAAEYLKQAYRQFCQLFANHLQASKRTSVQYPAESKRRGRFEESSSRDPIEESKEPTPLPWAPELFGSSSKDWKRVRQGCPLRSAGNEHQFLHASLIDYFVATIPVEQTNNASEEKTVAPEEKNQEPLLPSTSLVAPEPILSSPGESFLTLKTPLDIEMTPLSSSPLLSEPVKNKKRGGRLAAPVDPATQRLLDPKTIGFRVDELKDQPEKSQHYWDLIERSKTDEHVAMASANAATVLNVSGANLMGRDWQGVRIPGANLRLANLAHMNLSGADLTGVDLTRTWLYEVNLEQATLEDVAWGEKPRLECKGKGAISVVVHHPREPWLAIAQGDNIEIRHRETGDLICRPLAMHTRAVRSVSFSPDGALLASGSSDCSVRIWEVREGMSENLQNRVIKCNTNEVYSVLFSPDGQLLATGGNEMVQLWEVSTLKPQGEPLKGLGKEKGSASMSFSPDGKLLAIDSNGEVQLWEIETNLKPQVEPPVIGPEKRWTISFNADKKLQMVPVVKQEIKQEVVQLCKVASAKYVSSIKATPVTSLSFSPDGQLLATAEKQNLKLWEIASGKQLGTLAGHTDMVLGVSFSPNGQLLASSSKDRTVRLWQLANREPLGTPLTGHSGEVTSIAFSSDGQTLFSGSQDETVRVWPVETLKLQGAPLIGHNGKVTSVSFSPDGKLLASGGYDKTVRLWDVASGKPHGKQIKGHTGMVTSVAFSPKGRLLASGSTDRMVQLWNIASGKRRGATLMDKQAAGVRNVSFSPDGRLLASGNEVKGSSEAKVMTSDDMFLFLRKEIRRTLQLWKVASIKPHHGKPIKGHEIKGHKNTVASVSFSPDGKLLASGGYDMTVRLWDLPSRKPHGKAIQEKAKVTSVSFSPDGQLLAWGKMDNMIQLWDVAGGKMYGDPLTGHEERVTSVSFNPNGHILISGSEDKTVRLWEVESQRCLRVFTWIYSILSVALQHPLLQGAQEKDGQLLAALGDSNGVVSLWLLSADIFRGTKQPERMDHHKNVDEEKDKLTFQFFGRDNILRVGAKEGAEKRSKGDKRNLPYASGSEWKLLNASYNSGMLLCTQGVRLSGCRMGLMSKRLLQQTGAEVSRVVVLDK